MAAAFPRSQFVGVDYSSRHIERAQGMVNQLGLKNIRLVCKSIGDLTPDLGTFDSTTARPSNGPARTVYSCGNPLLLDCLVQRALMFWRVIALITSSATASSLGSRSRSGKILQICGEHLAPQGVAYVSYNAYPGWHLRGAVRDMMAFHTSKVEAPEERATRARALLDFLVKAVPDPNDAYGILLRKELELLQKVTDSYLIHEHLETNNDPIYFYQFMRRAEGHGLQFLAESELLSMATNRTGSQAENVIRGFASNTVELEQYTDFLRNRMFRQTLLCRKDVQLRKELDPGAFRRCTSPVHEAANSARQRPGRLYRGFVWRRERHPGNLDPRLKARRSSS